MTAHPLTARRRHGASPADWLIPAGLLALALVPILAGTMRLTELGSAPAVTPENARFVASPIPVVLHIVSATIYSVVGAFQFSPGLRRRHNGWHRAAGRVLAPMGLVVAATGLWMTAAYELPPGDGPILNASRWVVGLGMIAAIVLALRAVRRHDYPTHGAWMTRAYAIGLGAGTQVFTHLPWALASEPPDELTRAILMDLGWLINLVVAEWAIRRRATARSRIARAAG